MTKTKNPHDTSERIAARILVLANGATRALNALAADRTLAHRAATMAALPRQRLAELRALYTAQDSTPVTARVPKTARSPVFEFRSAFDDTRSLT